MGCISDLRGQGFGEGRRSGGGGRGERGNPSEGRERAASLPRQSYTEDAGCADIILGEANAVSATSCYCRIVAQLAHSDNSCHCEPLLEARPSVHTVPTVFHSIPKGPREEGLAFLNLQIKKLRHREAKSLYSQG